MQKWLDVAVSVPAHSQVGGLLTYVTELPASVGQLVRVPFGNREVLGVVWGVHTAAPETLSTHTLRQVIAVLEAVAPLSAHWQQLVQFTAHYYQRSLGEVAMAALPPQLRDLTPVQLARRFKKQATTSETLATSLQSPWPLSDQQADVLSQMAKASGPFSSSWRHWQRQNRGLPSSCCQVFGRRRQRTSLDDGARDQSHTAT